MRLASIAVIPSEDAGAVLLTFVPCPAPRSYFSYTPGLCRMTTSEPILLRGPFVGEKTSSVRGEVTCLARASGMQAQVSLSAERTPVGSSWENEEVRLCWRQSWRCPRPIHRLGPDPYGLVPGPLVHCAVEGRLCRNQEVFTPPLGSASYWLPNPRPVT